MATIGEFASILQLGFGVGAGLSVFRAPMDVRVSYLSKAIDKEISVVRGIKTDVARSKLGKLLQIKVRFTDRRIILEEEQRPFMFATALGAAINLSGLIIGSVNAGYQLTILQQAYLLFMSTLYYAVIGGILEVKARRQLSDIADELQTML